MTTLRRSIAVILEIATGMRAGEILGLRRCDVHLDSGEISVAVNAQEGYSGDTELVEPKTEAGKRVIPVPNFAIEALREHLDNQQPRSSIVFPGPDGKAMTADRFLRKWFHPICRKAGLPEMRFHDLRHSVATLLIEADVDAGTVSKILGHSSPAITLYLYGHTTSRMKRRAADIVQRLIANRSDEVDGVNSVS